MAVQSFLIHLESEAEKNFSVAALSICKDCKHRCDGHSVVLTEGSDRLGETSIERCRGVKADYYSVFSMADETGKYSFWDGARKNPFCIEIATGENSCGHFAPKRTLGEKISDLFHKFTL